MMFSWGRPAVLRVVLTLLFLCALLARPAAASVGDRMPEFRECVEVGCLSGPVVDCRKDRK